MPTLDRISAKEKATILAAVAEKHGELTPALVVLEADPRNSDGIAHRLAACVGWDRPDEEAALQWRTDQARAVIRSVEPELIQLGVMAIEAPYYVRDPLASPGQQGYVRTLGLKSHEEAAADAMKNEVARAVGALERAYGIAQALGLEAEAAEVLGALAALGRSPMAPPEVAGEGAAARS